LGHARKGPTRYMGYNVAATGQGKGKEKAIKVQEQGARGLAKKKGGSEYSYLFCYTTHDK
jgi:hypothetical protein